VQILASTWLFPQPPEQFVEDTLVGLAERGHHVQVVASRTRFPLSPRLQDLLDIRWVPAADAPGWPRHRTMRRLAAAFAHDPDRLAALVRALQASHGWTRMLWSELEQFLPFIEARPDVIHFEWADWATRYLEVMPFLSHPIVVSCRGSDVRVYPLASSKTRSRLQQMFDVVDGIHCVSAEIAQVAIANGAPPGKVVVIVPGVDTRYFATPRPEPSEQEDRPVRIVSSGRLHWLKGYEYALMAVHRLRQRGLSVTYTIAGRDEGGGDAMRLAIRDLGLQSEVSLLGHLDRSRLRSVLAESDIFLMSSVSEGLSIAVLEAMAAGLPAVVTDAGGLPEAVRDGEHGFVVPKRDPDAMARALERLVVDGDLRRDMGRRAAAHVRRHHDIDGEVDRLVAVYEDLIRALRPWHRSVSHAGPSPHSGPGDVPVVSVVMPARNAAATIDEQLAALTAQDYGGAWEVIVVDNGSTDSTRVQAMAWADRLPGLRVIDASGQPGVSHARNAGVRAARSERIVMCDSDDVVADDWLRHMAEALERHHLVTGAIERQRLNANHPGFWTDRARDSALREVGRYQTMVPGCAVGFRRDVFDQLDGFDTALPRAEDMDFGWRAIRAGYTPYFVPDAVVHMRARPRLSHVAGQAFGDGAAQVAVFTRHRAYGMPRDTVVQALRDYGRLLAAVPGLGLHADRRYGWTYDVGARLGRLAGSVRLRVLFP
jgi:colanic acid/amylovoran biosynthesis glycosyltransferase